MLECRNCPYYDYALGGQWCDKVGGYNYRFGYCSDIYDVEAIHKNHSKQKRRNKGERDQKHKNHLKFLAENILGYPAPVMYIDEIWVKEQGYIENPKPYYKRLYRGRGRRSNSNYHKKMSNGKIRRYKGELPKKVIWDINYMIFGGSCVKTIEFLLQRNGGNHNERGRISKDFGTIE